MTVGHGEASMQNLGETFKNLLPQNKGLLSVVPDEAQCPECGYFDPSHPDVQIAVRQRVDIGWKSFGVMAQCKCKAIEGERKEKALLRRQQANLPHEKGEQRLFENFEQTAATREMFEAIRDFAEGKPPHILMAVGSFGSGKSHLAEAAGRFVLARGYAVRYELVSSMLDSLRHTYHIDSDHDLQMWLEWYNTRYLLILDDLGMEAPKDWAIEKVSAIVDDRMRNGRRTIITTNKGEDGLKETVGPRLASRLYQTNAKLQDVRVVVTTAKDYRK